MRSRFATAFALGSLALAGCSRGGSTSYRAEPVTRGAITEVVSATGDVSAIVTVNIGSQVSGTISKLYVDFNSQVKKGQPLAELDPRLFRAALERAQAGLASAQADVEKAQAQLNDAARVEKRNKELLEQRLVSQQDVDSAVANREQMAASLSSARAKVLQARADRDQAATNLAFARIESPIDGIVVSRAVDVGQTVAASFQTPTLFTIANDLTKMQVLANIDEADVGKVHDGLEARFTVDAYPGDEFRGSIREVRQAPNTIQNVVTYAAVIDAANPERKLRQGMTAAVKVLTSHKDDVLRVSNAALRWKPENAPAPEQPAQRGDRTLARTERRAGPSAASAPGKPGRLYKLEGDKPVPVDVRIGISDGQRTEVMSGLAETDSVIVGDSAAGGSARPQGGRRGPF
ncbi:MAG TPA: efflux RND transporter periplasmic adaptor subunit [Myxococcales bacterium]|nr:efflux RND transporter periplasmic adaptor subunit [Myxococcales bacterium]